MRRLLTWLVAALLLPILATAALLIFAIEAQPLVERSDAISPLSIAQARRLLATHDPRRQRSGDIATVPIPASLIDEGVNYVAGRYLHGRGAFTLTDQGGEFRLTLPLPAPGFLNLRATVHPTDGMPTIAAASLGRLPLPSRLVDFGIAQAVRIGGFNKEWQMASRAIRNVAFDVASESVTVTYEWEPLILDRARAVALSPEEIKQLREARQALAALLAHRAPGSVVSLAEILRATLPTQGDNPVSHGRAALLVLASHLAHIDLAALVPAARAWPHIRWVNITLAGRHDLAQHFAVSATLAAWAGEPIADAIGLYKELADARHGSGFSFADLAADRAGTRFGELIVHQPRQIDRLVKTTFADQDIVPSQRGL